MLAGRIAQVVLSFLRYMVLARLIGPRDFGILGVAMLCMDTLETLTQTGFTAALVQDKRNDVRTFLDTVWSINILRGIFLFGCLFALTPLLVNFFDGSPHFNNRDFRNPQKLIEHLQQDKTALASYLRENASETAQAALTQAVNAKPSIQQEALSRLFNDVAARELLYTPQRFEGIPLTPYTIGLLQHPAEIPRLNRLLLEQAFPETIIPVLLDRPQTITVIRTLGLLLLIRALTNIATIYFTREMRFEKLFGLQFAGTVANVAVTVGLAVVYRNVWAMVWGMIVSGIITLILGYVLEPHKPQFRIDRRKAKSMWSFGRWISGATILDFLLNQGDSIVVSRMLGAYTLGLYQMAYKVSNLPISEMANTIMTVTFPAFCRIQSEENRLKEAFLKANEMAVFLGLPWLGVLLALGDDLVTLFFQPQWATMIMTLKILTVWAMIRILGSGGGAIYQALGRPQYCTFLGLFRLVLIALLLYPSIRWYGMAGAAWAVLISTALTMIPGYVFLRQLLKSSYYEILSRQVPTVLSVTAAVFLVWWIKAYLWTSMGFLRLSVLGFVLLGVYVALTFLLSRYFNGQIMAAILPYWVRFRKSNWFNTNN